MDRIFGFGETVPGCDVPVLNEREVRAAAGILLVFAMMTFANAWFMGNFRPTKIFVIAFLVDFTIRFLIDPKYSPSMILGRFAVRKQVPEWAGAPQKRFAWAIGWTLAVTMLWLIGVIAWQGFPATDAVTTVAPTSAAPGGDDRCTPPAFAVAIGHAEKWKLHNNCK